MARAADALKWRRKQLEAKTHQLQHTTKVERDPGTTFLNDYSDSGVAQ